MFHVRTSAVIAYAGRGQYVFQLWAAIRIESLIDLSMRQRSLAAYRRRVRETSHRD
jgi:hypothetical protein